MLERAGEKGERERQKEREREREERERERGNYLIEENFDRKSFELF